MTDHQKQGKSNKRKEWYYENRVVTLASSFDLFAARDRAEKADVIIEKEKFEVKSRKRGFGFDEILDDPRLTGLITFDTSRRGTEPLVRLRLTEYLRLRAEIIKLQKRLLNG